MAVSINNILCVLLLLVVSTSAQPSPSPGLFALCERCVTNANCETGFCVLGLCLSRNAPDISRCLGPRTPPRASIRPIPRRSVRPAPERSVRPSPRRRRSGLRACARCDSDDQCVSGLRCSGRPPVCHDGRRGSLRACHRGFRCPRCPVVPPARPVPATPPPLDDCAPCTAPEECGSNYCSFGLCGPPPIAARCLLPECRQCDKDSQCITGKCWSEVCTYGDVGSLVRCGYTPPCGPCTSDDMCATLECRHGICVQGRNGPPFAC